MITNHKLRNTIVRVNREIETQFQKISKERIRAAKKEREEKSHQSVHREEKPQIYLQINYLGFLG